MRDFSYLLTVYAITALVTDLGKHAYIMGVAYWIVGIVFMPPSVAYRAAVLVGPFYTLPWNILILKLTESPFLVVLVFGNLLRRVWTWPTVWDLTCCCGLGLIMSLVILSIALTLASVYIVAQVPRLITPLFLFEYVYFPDPFPYWVTRVATQCASWAATSLLFAMATRYK